MTYWVGLLLYRRNAIFLELILTTVVNWTSQTDPVSFLNKLVDYPCMTSGCILVALSLCHVRSLVLKIIITHVNTQLSLVHAYTAISTGSCNRYVIIEGSYIEDKPKGHALQSSLLLWVHTTVLPYFHAYEDCHLSSLLFYCVLDLSMSSIECIHLNWGCTWVQAVLKVGTVKAVIHFANAYESCGSWEDHVVWWAVYRATIFESIEEAKLLKFICKECMAH